MEQLTYHFGNRKCKSHKEKGSLKEIDLRQIRSYPMSPCCPPVKVTDPPIPLGEVHGLKCQGVAVTSDKLKPMKDGRNKAS